MIADKDTNFVYFSDKFRSDIRVINTCDQITELLDLFGEKYDFLLGTKDIWTRDYMPIQLSEKKFIEFRYDPDYLQAKKYRKDKTYPDIVCEALKLKTTKTELIIDGGNVIKADNCVIMTDKVVEENKDICNQELLIGKLKELFEVERIALIPWDKENDFYGHADGMIRFISKEKVLIQGYFDEYSEIFKRKLYGALEQNGLHWEKIKYEVEEEDDRNWAYLNFLQTNNLILIPEFNIDEDEQALKQIKKYYPEYTINERIKQVNMIDIVKYGGALNCITWTIKK